MGISSGLGLCCVPTVTGGVCGLPIKEGEPIASFVSIHGPQIGHKMCINNFNERNESMVQRVSQQGAAGAIDYSHPVDLLQNSVPIPQYKSGKTDTEPESPKESIPDNSHKESASVRMPSSHDIKAETELLRSDNSRSKRVESFIIRHNLDRSPDPQDAVLCRYIIQVLEVIDQLASQELW